MAVDSQPDTGDEGEGNAVGKVEAAEEDGVGEAGGDLAGDLRLAVAPGGWQRTSGSVRPKEGEDGAVIERGRYC